jgi:hypothetical protein
MRLHCSVRRNTDSKIPPTNRIYSLSPVPPLGLTASRGEVAPGSLLTRRPAPSALDATLATPHQPERPDGSLSHRRRHEPIADVWPTVPTTSKQSMAVSAAAPKH